MRDVPVAERAVELPRSKQQFPPLQLPQRKPSTGARAAGRHIEFYVRLPVDSVGMIAQWVKFKIVLLSAQNKPNLPDTTSVYRTHDILTLSLHFSDRIFILLLPCESSTTYVGCTALLLMATACLVSWGGCRCMFVY